MPSPAQPAAPPSEEERAATRPVLWFSVVLLTGLWLSIVRAPWPLTLVPGVLALLALVLGVMSLVRLRRARTGRAMAVLVVVGMVIAAGMVLIAVLQALLWPVYADFHACLDRALTHRAESACLTDLEEHTQSFVLDLVR